MSHYDDDERDRREREADRTYWDNDRRNNDRWHQDHDVSRWSGERWDNAAGWNRAHGEATTWETSGGAGRSGRGQEIWSDDEMSPRWGGQSNSAPPFRDWSSYQSSGWGNRLSLGRLLTIACLAYWFWGSAGRLVAALASPSDLVYWGFSALVAWLLLWCALPVAWRPGILRRLGQTIRRAATSAGLVSHTPPRWAKIYLFFCVLLGKPWLDVNMAYIAQGAGTDVHAALILVPALLAIVALMVTFLTPA